MGKVLNKMLNNNFGYIDWVMQLKNRIYLIVLIKIKILLLIYVDNDK